MNAKEELLNHVGGRPVELIRIIKERSFSSIPQTEISGTLDDVLPKLDFIYDSGYGSQELFGYIWYTDGTWSERGEYDGAELWEYKQRPDINIDIET